MDKNLSKTKWVFVFLFIALSIVGMKINFSNLIGAENQFFTLFQFWGPIAGGFLGPVYGVLTVFSAQMFDFLVNGKQLTLLNVARILPMLFAAYYFSQYKTRKLDDKLSLAIPILAIFAFWLHPVGQQAWYFAVFWTIPIIVKFLPDFVMLRSIGATFSAHAVGGAIWAWAVPMTVAQWNSLIPIVIFERTLFAVGIAISYFAFTTVLNAIDHATNGKISKLVNIEKYAVLKI